MDVYGMVTDRIIEELEKGIVPWKKPWVGAEGAVSHVTGKAYSLLNQLLLGKSGEWLTFNQVKKEGGSVKKGEKSRFVVFWKFLNKETDKLDENGEKVVERIPYLHYFNVFHIDQCEGIKPKHNKPVSDLKADEKAQEVFDEYITREGIALTHEDGSSYYSPAKDAINLPMMNRFHKLAEYYSTAFHEAVHSTGAKKRLDRIAAPAFFGSEDYSKEELVAEIGSSMILNMVGMETDSSFANNVAYIENWLSVLKNDKRFIVSAAGKAEKAVKFILNEKDEEIPRLIQDRP